MTSINAQQLQHDGLQQLHQQHTNDDNLLMVRDANYWIDEASSRAIPQMLFGKFWHQGEVCILFADSNLGKSILAVQIADSISKGKGSSPFNVEPEAQPVLYCDFELTGKQFEARYSANYTDHYVFSPHFLRAELNTDPELLGNPDHFDDNLIYDLECSVVTYNAKVLIIDNLTFLRTETEQAKDALPLMKQLKNLKNKYDLSILVLAHTPKRDLTQGITRNDLQGSKMLMNFCDSAFTIGESNVDSNLRYLKQIKQRNTEQVYGESNICLCRISKPHNFLHYDFVEFGEEWQQLLKRKKAEPDGETMAKVLAFKEQNYSLREIGRELGISHQKVDRMLKAHEANM